MKSVSSFATGILGWGPCFFMYVLKTSSPLSKLVPSRSITAFHSLVGKNTPLKLTPFISSQMVFTLPTYSLNSLGVPAHLK